MRREEVHNLTCSNVKEARLRPVEKLLSSALVFKGKILSVRVDSVELRSGRKTTREVVDRPGTVSILALDNDGQALLVRQFRYTLGIETLEIPAGTIDTGEAPEEAARRELREETGFDCHHLEPLISYGPAIGYSTERMTVFFAAGLYESPLRGDEEYIHLERRHFDEVYQAIVSGSNLFQDAKSVMAILTARARGLA